MCFRFIPLPSGIPPTPTPAIRGSKSEGPPKVSLIAGFPSSALWAIILPSAPARFRMCLQTIVRMPTVTLALYFPGILLGLGAFSRAYSSRCPIISL